MDIFVRRIANRGVKRDAVSKAYIDTLFRKHVGGPSNRDLHALVEHVKRTLETLRKTYEEKLNVLMEETRRNFASLNELTVLMEETRRNFASLNELTNTLKNKNNDLEEKLREENIQTVGIRKMLSAHDALLSEENKHTVAFLNKISDHDANFAALHQKLTEGNDASVALGKEISNLERKYLDITTRLSTQVTQLKSTVTTVGSRSFFLLHLYAPPTADQNWRLAQAEGAPNNKYYIRVDGTWTILAVYPSFYTIWLHYLKGGTTSRVALSANMTLNVQRGMSVWFSEKVKHGRYSLLVDILYELHLPPSP